MDLLFLFSPLSFRDALLLLFLLLAVVPGNRHEKDQRASAILDAALGTDDSLRSATQKKVGSFLYPCLSFSAM